MTKPVVSTSTNPIQLKNRYNRGLILIKMANLLENVGVGILGADGVIHSATKFLGGHGTTLGGVVVESGRFNWANGNFPLMTEPMPSYNNVSWWGNFGEYGFLTKLRSEQLRDFGPALSPQSAFNLLQGVETLPQRMDTHLDNTKKVVDWLVEDEIGRAHV